MTLIAEKETLRQVMWQVFERATAETMGPTFPTIMCFHMKQMLGKDPFEVLIDDPKTFYNALAKILGTGAEAVLSLVCSFLTKKYNMPCATDEFVRIFFRGDESSKHQLQEMLTKLAGQIEKTAK